MSLTLIIPCYHKHFKYLDKCLNYYLEGTELPDQIIISLNGCNHLQNNLINDFKKKYETHFKEFKLIKTSNQINSAEARNLAIPFISNDIVSFCDADDSYHPQRVEIIKYFFKNYDIECLLHSYILAPCYNNKNKNHCFLCQNNKNNIFKNYDLSEIKYCNTEETFKLNYYNDKIQPDVKTIIAINSNKKQILPTHGLSSFKREVFSKIKFNKLYKRGQDSLFCQEVLKEFKKTIVLDAELIIYKNNWIPQKNQFKNFNNIYINLGADNPPPPGKPRSKNEHKFIDKAIKELYNY